MVFQREISADIEATIGAELRPRIAARHTEAVIQSELRRMARALRGDDRRAGVRARFPLTSGARLVHDDPSR